MRRQVLPKGLPKGLPIEGSVRFAENNPHLFEYAPEPENEFNGMLLQAIRDNQFEQAEKALADGAEIDCKTEQDVTALGLAARLAREEIFKLLLRHEPKIVGEDRLGNTILLQAVHGDNAGIISALVQSQKLPKKYLDQKNNHAESPLKLAARNGNPAIFAQLLKLGAQIKDDFCQQALIPCIEQQISRALESSQKKDLNKQFLNVVKGSDVSSVLNYVCNGADINARDDLGETALMVAVRLANDDTIDELIKLGAKINAQNYFGGMTALHQAVQYDRLPAVKLLTSSRADLSILDSNGYTPVMLAQQLSKDSSKQGRDIEQYLRRIKARQDLYKKLFNVSMGLSVGIGATVGIYSIYQKYLAKI